MISGLGISLSIITPDSDEKGTSELPVGVPVDQQLEHDNCENLGKTSHLFNGPSQPTTSQLDDEPAITIAYPQLATKKTPPRVGRQLKT
jgi:hypothetical protein